MEGDHLIHGTTIGTNAIVKGKGGKVGLHIMQSNAASMTVEEDKKYAVQLMNSGPARGAITAALISRIAGNEMATISPPFVPVLLVMKGRVHRIPPWGISTRQVSPF